MGVFRRSESVKTPVPLRPASTQSPTHPVLLVTRQNRSMSAITTFLALALFSGMPSLVITPFSAGPHLWSGVRFFPGCRRIRGSIGVGATPRTFQDELLLFAPLSDRALREGRGVCSQVWRGGVGGV
ncbi:hypothetical protein C8R45DRAFT_1220941, partial [Mycena sanguinolenta]